MHGYAVTSIEQSNASFWSVIPSLANCLARSPMVRWTFSTSLFQATASDGDSGSRTVTVVPSLSLLSM